MTGWDYELIHAEQSRLPKVVQELRETIEPSFRKTKIALGAGGVAAAALVVEGICETPDYVIGGTGAVGLAALGYGLVKNLLTLSVAEQHDTDVATLQTLNREFPTSGYIGGGGGSGS